MTIMKKIGAFCILILVFSLTLSGCAKKEIESSGENTGTEESAKTLLTAPTDFTYDPNTGSYSFIANDTNAAYYFIRAFGVVDGVEQPEYVASTKRLKGGATGEMTGKISLDGFGWGTYNIKLVTFAAAGSNYEAPEAQAVTVQYGVDLPLERPEMLVMSSGNQVELVVDWWTLCDYQTYQYMPMMTFTFYSDEALTRSVMSDTVDLHDLLATQKMNPPGLEYIWGYTTSEGLHYYTTDSDSTFAFIYDLYTYSLDAGDYYVTCQAISKDDYTLDSKVSTPVMFTLTDEAPTEAFNYATTQLWTDPQQMDMPGANPGQQPDRVDVCTEQPVSGQVIQ